MPKIYYENGLLAEFESWDELSDGNLFIHGLRNINIGNVIVYSAKQGPMPELPEEAKKAISSSKVVDLDSRREVKPEVKEETKEELEAMRPLMRKAIPPPKEEPKLGFMCPHCHQSRIVFLGTEGTFDSDILPYNVIIESLDVAPRFIYSSNNDYSIAIGKDKYLDKEERDAFIQLPDATIGSRLPEPWKSIQDTVNRLEKNTHGCCDNCNTVAPMQAWINEFAQPTTPYFHTCRICGGEMDFTCEAGTFNHRADNQEIKCEKCGHTANYNIGTR